MSSKLEAKRDKLDEKRDKVLEQLDKIERKIIDSKKKPSKSDLKTKMKLEDLKDDLDEKIEDLDRDIVGMEGSGLFDFLERTNPFLLPKVIKDADKAKLLEHLDSIKGSGQVGYGFLRGLQKTINLVTKGKVNPEWDYAPKRGETHAPVVGPDGKLYRDRFSGPGTHLQENIQELLDKYGDVGVTFNKETAKKWSPNPDISLTALVHDIAYAMAREMPKGKKRNDYIRKADDRFLNNMKKVTGKSGFLPKTLIGMKMQVLGPDAFASKFEGTQSIPKSEKNMFKRIESVLAHQGYGKRATKRRPLRGGGFMDDVDAIRLRAMKEGLGVETEKGLYAMLLLKHLSRN